MPVRWTAIILVGFLSARSAEIPKEAQDIVVLLAQLDSAPPEIAADLKLQLVEKGFVKAKETRLGALRESFDLAARAAFKVPPVIGGAGGSLKAPESHWTSIS